jgi:hypothetical protein
LQSIENQTFLATAKPLQSHCKATAKKTAKQQTVENQALCEIFCSFAVKKKKYIQTPPHPYPLTPISQFFLYISFLLQKLQNKNKKINKNIERVALEAFAVFFAVPLQWLCSFLPNSKNCVITSTIA